MAVKAKKNCKKDSAAFLPPSPNPSRIPSASTPLVEEDRQGPGSAEQVLPLPGVGQVEHAAPLTPRPQRGSHTRTTSRLGPGRQRGWGGWFRCGVGGLKELFWPRGSICSTPPFPQVFRIIIFCDFAPTFHFHLCKYVSPILYYNLLLKRIFFCNSTFGICSGNALQEEIDIGGLGKLQTIEKDD